MFDILLIPCHDLGSGDEAIKKASKNTHNLDWNARTAKWVGYLFVCMFVGLFVCVFVYGFVCLFILFVLFVYIFVLESLWQLFWAAGAPRARAQC